MRIHSLVLILPISAVLVQGFSACKPRKGSAIKAGASGESCAYLSEELKTGSAEERFEKGLTTSVIAQSSSDTELRKVAAETIQAAQFSVDTASDGLNPEFVKQATTQALVTMTQYVSSAETADGQAEQTKFLTTELLPVALKLNDAELAGRIVSTAVDVNAAQEIKKSGSGNVVESTRNVLDSIARSPGMSVVFANPAISGPIKSQVFTTLKTVEVVTGNPKTVDLAKPYIVNANVTPQLAALGMIRGKLASQAPRDAIDAVRREVVDPQGRNIVDEVGKRIDAGQSPEKATADVATAAQLKINPIEPAITQVIRMKNKIRVPTP